MRSWQQTCLMAVLSLSLSLVAWGCSGSKEESAKPEKAAASAAKSEEKGNRLEEIREVMCEAVSQVPADAAVVVTFRSPQAVVDGLNDSIGPELASMAAVPLALLPSGAIEMDGPVVFALLMQERPLWVFLMCCKEPRFLKGETVDEGIIRMKVGNTEFHVLKMGAYAAFGDLDAVRAYKKAKDQPLAVDQPMGDRIAENLIWLYVNAKPLAALAKPMIDGMKKEAEQKHPGQPLSSEAKAVQWLQDLLDQLKSAEIGYAVSGGRVLVRGRLTLAENAPLLAIARAVKPIETYEGALPQTDKFLMAAWANVDSAQATPHAKAFLRPVMDLVMEKLGEATTAPAGAPVAGAPNPMAALRQAIDEQWSLADEYGAVLGNRAAVLMEMPERGKPFYRFTETVDLKDVAKYRVLAKKSAESTEKLLKALTGRASEDKAAPNVKMDFEYKPGAETIDGVAVDVMRFKFGVQPGPGVPPEAERIVKSINETLYGPDGLVMRMAVCDNQVLAVTGDPEMMKRAIKGRRGQAGDLAKQPPIAAALKRVPKGASMAALISCPASAYAGDVLIDEAMLAALPPERREAMKRIPLPKINPPVLSEPTVLSLVVDGQAIRLEMDMPLAEGANSVPYLRHMYGRIFFNVFQLIPGFVTPESPEGRAGGEPPMMLPGLAAQARGAKVDTARITIKAIEMALEAFNVNCGRYPTTAEGLKALREEPATVKENWRGPYLKESPTDPWGNPYVYVCPGRHNTDLYDLYSFGPDGMEGGGDDIGNWSRQELPPSEAAPPAASPEAPPAPRPATRS
jgi:general secretion pathway protein G